MKTPEEWAAGIRYAGPQSARNLAAVVEALTLAVAEARADGEAAGREAMREEAIAVARRECPSATAEYEPGCVVAIRALPVAPPVKP
jgi:hypothetical protein